MALLHKDLKDSAILIRLNSSDNLGMRLAQFCEFIQEGNFP